MPHSFSSASSVKQRCNLFCEWRTDLKGLTALVHGEQISCQLACHCESGAIAMPALQLSGMKSCQL